jgi:hypothetical protein
LFWHQDQIKNISNTQHIYKLITMMMNRLAIGFLLLLGVASAAMTDPATGIAFAPRLDSEREIVGVGVRKKGPIKVR